MSLTEAIKRAALRHKEQIDKTIIAVTYIGDLIVGAPGVKHPYQEAWVNPLIRATQKLGYKAVATEAEIAQISDLSPSQVIDTTSRINVLPRLSAD